MLECVPPLRLLVTGGAGFIGSAACRYFVKKGWTVCNVDKLTYAANLDNLRGVISDPRYHFVEADICDKETMRSVFAKFRPDAVLHLAAESHVDRSLEDANTFIETNVVGTVNLLQVALDYWIASGKNVGFRFHHVSTDEVYGDLPLDGHDRFTETTPYNPSSPYSASKAASDFMVMSWHRTFGLPVVLSNCSNNYGPYQNTEKLIPLMIIQGLRGSSMPVYGNGQNIRDWLHVDDHIEALELVLTRGELGRRYNIGGSNEWANIHVVKQICNYLDERLPLKSRSHHGLITYVTDRPGHDLRYAIDDALVRLEFGWRPRRDFLQGLAETVDWYIANRWWWERDR